MSLQISFFSSKLYLRRVQADICFEIGYILGLLELGPFLIVHHGHIGDPFVSPSAQNPKVAGESWKPSGRHWKKNQWRPMSPSGTSVIKKRLLGVLVMYRVAFCHIVECRS
ncbi:hypothetical protein [Adlercreutzia aquisgranensis]|uniref:hypothetical protein n=1 Tax=Adlercreutzia aquisgranensis TaxID=2941323 RepID=UPI0020408B95|nr:hypothetical protein [Adlercreutzia aquisgranensis]